MYKTIPLLSGHFDICPMVSTIERGIPPPLYCSIGILAGAMWGAMYGFSGVPENHYLHVEYEERISKLGIDLLRKANSIERNTSVKE